MLYTATPAALTVGGRSYTPALHPDAKLARAVAISLFSWRRANDDDELPGDERMGWWGDSYADESGDRIGSRLWLLARATLTQRTLDLAREYAVEALAWLTADGVATSIDVTVERLGLTAAGMTVTVNRASGGPLALRYDDLWTEIRNGL
ncbi:phage GP46 family protein [Derxia gummosa]|uniref:Phage GP46 family protein n=1 Tax=Derxia gummosa DSM 723 TaxID=1121388 RepID=A0A8B6X3R6_9BURK|nr:phage GP46 family protein [Derxia gummosa]